jgi:hypothetical protein
MPVTQAGLRTAVIQHARVLDVNMATYTVTVATEYAKKPLPDLSFMVPYTHFNSGEGVYFMPEVGSLVWICQPSDGSWWFVLGWTTVQDEKDFRGRRRDLNPGDIFLGTRDDNFIYLRRGGVVQIGATGICQRIFLPVNNTIKDFCENYGLHTLSGDLEWTIAREESTTDGSRPALFKLYAKEKADDQDHIAELEIGSHDGDDTTILSLKIKDSGQVGAAEKITLKMGKDGTVNWDCQSNVTWSVKGKWSLSTSDDASISSNKKISLTAKSDLTATGSTAKLEAKSGNATVRSPKAVVLDAPRTQAGGPSANLPVILAPPLLTWLATHVHQIVLPVPGSPTSPPTVPPPPSVVSKTLFAR